MRFIRSAGAELIGLFVADWVQTAVILVILAAGWYAIGVLHASPIPVLVALVVLLAGQMIWFTFSEARRSRKPA